MPVESFIDRELASNTTLSCLSRPLPPSLLTFLLSCCCFFPSSLFIYILFLPSCPRSSLIEFCPLTSPQVSHHHYPLILLSYSLPSLSSSLSLIYRSPTPEALTHSHIHTQTHTHTPSVFCTATAASLLIHSSLILPE